MRNSKNLNLSALIPGFDMFKQMAGQIPGVDKNLGTGASNPFMPNPSSWIAPTLSVEELEKRITELKTVKLWLENNARLIEATTQALQVQKMTLSTLQEMKVNLGKAWPGMAGMATADPAAPASRAAGAKTSSSRSKTHFDLGASTSPTGKARKPAAKASAQTATKPKPEESTSDTGSAAMQLASQQAMQMWQGLTQQFGQIANQVMQDSQAAANKLAASPSTARRTASKTPVAAKRSRSTKK